MKNIFDNDLKQRLDNASLQEAGVRFDQDKLWGKIENKRNKKQTLFLPWVTHAAAVAAGLAIGIFFFVHKDQPVNVQKVAMQQKNTPVLQPATDTIYMVKNEHPQPQKTISKTVIKTTQQVTVATEQTALPEARNNMLLVKEELSSLAFNVRMQPKVLHLTDIENENSTPHIRAEQKNTLLYMVLSKQNRSESNTETLSMLLAQKLNLTRN